MKKIWLKIRFWVGVVLLILSKVWWDIGVAIYANANLSDLFIGNCQWIAGAATYLLGHHLLLIGWHMPPKRSGTKFWLGTIFFVLIKVWWDIFAVICTYTNFSDLIIGNGLWIIGPTALLLTYHLIHTYWRHQPAQQSQSCGAG